MGFPFTIYSCICRVGFAVQQARNIQRTSYNLIVNSLFSHAVPRRNPISAGQHIVHNSRFKSGRRNMNDDFPLRFAGGIGNHLLINGKLVVRVCRNPACAGSASIFIYGSIVDGNIVSGCSDIHLRGVLEYIFICAVV